MAAVGVLRIGERDIACYDDPLIPVEEQENAEAACRIDFSPDSGVVTVNTDRLDENGSNYPLQLNPLKGRLTGLTVVPQPGQDITAGDAVSVAFYLQANRLKSPVAAVSTDNVQLGTDLYAGCSVDDVVLVEGDRVLLLGQTDSVENGLWVIPETGASPYRPDDLPVGAPTFGLLVYSLPNPKPKNASLHADRFFMCTTDTYILPAAIEAEPPPPLTARRHPAADDRPRGSTSTDTGQTNWTETNNLDRYGNGGGLLVGGGGLHRARVAVMTGSNPPIGDPPQELVAGLHLVPDGDARTIGVTLREGDVVLLTQQPDAKQNGLWVVGPLASERAPDLPDNGITDAAGRLVFVYAANTVAGGRLFLCTNPPGSGLVGQTELYFSAVAHHPGQLAGDGLVPDATTAASLTVDWEKVPHLQRPTGNTFQGPVTLRDRTACTGPNTGALVVAGGASVGGDLYCGNLFSLSDMRLKRDIRPLSDPLDALGRMNGCTFLWQGQSNSDRRVCGLLAQEVRDAGPDARYCVDQSPEGLLAVDYTKIVPLLVEGIKTLARRCDALERTQRHRPYSRDDRKSVRRHRQRTRSV